MRPGEKPGEKSLQIRGASALSWEEIETMMASAWIIRIATLGADLRINLTPLWYCWAGGNIYAYTRGQKVRNLRANPHCTVLVDQNERYPELKGVMFQGTARVLETADAEKEDPYLDSVVRDLSAEKYALGGFGSSGRTKNTSTAMGESWRWIVISPERGFSWDNGKLRREAGRKS